MHNFRGFLYKGPLFHKDFILLFAVDEVGDSIFFDFFERLLREFFSDDAASGDFAGTFRIFRVFFGDSKEEEVGPWFDQSIAEGVEESIQVQLNQLGRRPFGNCDFLGVEEVDCRRHWQIRIGIGF